MTLKRVEPNINAFYSFIDIRQHALFLHGWFSIHIESDAGPFVVELTRMYRLYSFNQPELSNNWINNNVGGQVWGKLSTVVTGSTPWSRFISICLLRHYMKDTLLRTPELIWPTPNGGQVLSDVVMHTLYTGKSRTVAIFSLFLTLWHVLTKEQADATQTSLSILKYGALKWPHRVIRG